MGQGVDLQVDVPARDKRPKLELPAVKGARLWVVDETFRPVAMSAIGNSLASDNVFSTRLRLVATSAGRVEVPPIGARLGERSGRSTAVRLTAESPPVAGRPAGYLGGVGEFTTTAEVDQPQVRVGQELAYKIRIEGPGAWGMTTRPALERLLASAVEPRVEDRPDETIDEPPGRAFVYRLRPMKAGEVTLPPVVIASYDPRIGRYVTRASNGVPLKVVAVPAFNAGGLDYRPPPPGWSAGAIAATAAAAVAIALGTAVYVFRRRLTQRLRRWFPPDRRAAGRYAGEAARRLGSPGRGGESLARETLGALVEHARLSVGRPPGALTPDEARAAAADASGSDELGRRAAELAARCDRILFAARGSGGVDPAESDRLRREARELFEALGRPGGRWGWLSGRRTSGS